MTFVQNVTPVPPATEVFLKVDGSGVTQPVSGTVTANPLADTTATGTITAVNQTVVLALGGRTSVGAIALATTNFFGRLVYQESPDGGTTWFGGIAGRTDGGGPMELMASQFDYGGGADGPHQFVFFPRAGVSHVRFLCDAYTSGSITITIRANFTSNRTVDYSVGVIGDAVTGSGIAGSILSMIRLMRDRVEYWLNSATDLVTNRFKTQATLEQYTPVSGRLPVDGSGVVQPVGLETPAAAELTSASINFTATGDNTVVVGVGGQTIRVFRIFFVVGAATNITIKDGAATSLTGVMSMTANGSFVLDFDGEPWFVTSAGNAFIVNQSGTAQVSGRVYYEQS